MLKFPRNMLGLAALVCSGSLLTAVAAQAVTVTNVSYLPYANDAFPDPEGLLGGSLDRTKNTPVNVGSERDLRGTRANAQTFVVSADEYGPRGIQISAFVMNFEQYNFDSNNFLGVELFPVDDPLGPSIYSPGNVDFLGTRIVSGSSLQIPDPGQENAAGTALFHFDAPVILAPGAYAWRFLPTNEMGTQSKWSLTQDNSYPAGRRYEYNSTDYTEDQPAASGGTFPSEDYHFGFIGQALLPKLIIDRTTGNMTLENASDQSIDNIVGYSILSTSGSLNPDGETWNSIADSNPNWTELPSDAFNLSEENFGPDFQGISLAAGGSLSFGNVWLPWYDESSDISMLLNIDDGTPEGEFLPVEVRYVAGTGNQESFVQGDFNFDGSVDVDDYQIFLSSFPSSLAVGSPREGYVLGDINGDDAIDFLDIADFRAAYEAQHGAGSFAALSSQAVPEPQSIVLLCLFLGGIGLILQRQKMIACRKLAVASLVGLVGLMWPATAQSISLTATNLNSANESHVYEVVEGGFNLGAEVFLDRNHTVSNLPIFLQGVDYVKTANGDRGRTAEQNFAVELTFDPGAMLFLSIDGRVGDGDTSTPPTLGDGVMDWVLTQGWQPTGMKWYKSDGPNTPYYVYSLRPDGNSLTLYEQNSGSINMYSIAGGLAETMFPTITVNTETGQVSLKNPTQHTLALDYYEITSASNSLAAESWLSLDQQNIGAIDGDDSGTIAGDSPLEGWDRGGNSNDGHLAEIYLLGSSTFETGTSYSLGNAYNTDINGQDLVFRFSLAGEDALYEGLVEYVTGSVGLPGDYNGDGIVDLADYTVWRNSLGTSVTLPNDLTPGTVDIEDYSVWKDHFGNSATLLSAPPATVPEPGTIVFAAVALTATLACRVRRTGGFRR